MKASPKPRKPANLSESVHQQLSMYALAASAAGVGALCFAKPAEARIVYTPAHVAIKANGGLFRIDLNHDGTPDLGSRTNGPVTSPSALGAWWFVSPSQRTKSG